MKLEHICLQGVDFYYFYPDMNTDYLAITLANALSKHCNVRVLEWQILAGKHLNPRVEDTIFFCENDKGNREIYACYGCVFARPLFALRVREDDIFKLFEHIYTKKVQQDPLGYRIFAKRSFLRKNDVLEALAARGLYG